MQDSSQAFETGGTKDTEKKRQARIKALEAQIAELQKRWPAHSTPPGMMAQLDELESELEAERRKLTDPPDATSSLE